MDLHVDLDRPAGHLSAQLAHALRGAVRAGRLGSGTRLPSTRDLAADLGVSRGVVVGAYEQLVAEGLVVSRAGGGTRVAAAVADGVPVGGDRADGRNSRPDVGRRLRLAAGTVAPPVAQPGIVDDLRPGKPDLSSFPRTAWSAAVREVTRALPAAEFSYPDPAGAQALRHELAGYLRRVRAAVAAPDQLVVLAGVAQLLALLPRVLREEGHTTIAVENPMGPHQTPMLWAAGIDVIPVPVDDEGVSVSALAATRTRAVLLTPAHQYPTGVVLSARRRAELISWARDRDALVVEDDYDAEFRYDRDPVGCVQGLAPEHVVLTGSVSKTLSPALRLGWALAPLWIAARLTAERALLDLGSPVLDQHALAHLIASGGYDHHLRHMRRSYRSRRDALVEALAEHLPSVRVRGVSAGLHVYAELPPGSDEAAVVAAAAERGIAVASVGPMRHGPGAPALVLGYARLSEHRLAGAIRRLAEAITSVSG